MKRLLTLKEVNYLKAALAFYEKFGPEETVVRTLAPSAFRKETRDTLKKLDAEIVQTLDKSVIPEIISVIDSASSMSPSQEDLEDMSPSQEDLEDMDPPQRYYHLVRSYLGDRVDDAEDELALAIALNRYSSELITDARESWDS